MAYDIRTPFLTLRISVLFMMQWIHDSYAHTYFLKQQMLTL